MRGRNSAPDLGEHDFPLVTELVLGRRTRKAKLLEVGAGGGVRALCYD